MDEESSSPTPAASASNSSQPTYTTAGTIYKPNSSQRLQPPTRRGRLLKATSDTTANLFENSKFGYPRHVPDAQLGRSAWSAKFTKAEDPLPRLPQPIPYRPLQQNYDRAVSPVNAPDQELKMSSLAPRQAVPRFNDLKGKGPAIDTSSSDDEDDTFTTALMNMTFKSLQNLASYPNPNQRRARKALRRGTKPRAGSALGGPSRLGTPSVYRNASPIGGGVSLHEEPSNGLRHTLSDPAALRQSYMRPRKPARFIRSEAAPYTDYQSGTVSSQLSTPSIHSDNSDPNPLTSMTLATGVGAPKPLTAGPPGQRQYRPSTFESTFKALNTMPTASQDSIPQIQEEVISPEYTEEDEAYIPDFHLPSRPSPVTPAAYQLANNDRDEEILSAPDDTLLDLIANSDPEAPLGTDELSQWLPYGTNSGGDVEDYYYYHHPEVSSEDYYHHPEVSSEDYYYHPEVSSEDYYHHPEVYSEDYYYSTEPFTLRSAVAPLLAQLWSKYESHETCEPTTPMFPQSMGCPVLLTEAEIQERNLRLNIHWYAGTGLLGDAYPLPQPIVEDTYPPVAKNIYGAVGDGRPTQGGSAGGGGDDRPVGNMASTPDDSSIMSGLALLGEVLSRAIDAV